MADRNRSLMETEPAWRTQLEARIEDLPVALQAIVVIYLNDLAPGTPARAAELWPVEYEVAVSSYGMHVVHNQMWRALDIRER